MLQRLRDRFHLLPTVYKAVIGVLCLSLVAGLAVVWWTSRPEECGEGLEQTGPAGECVGVTEHAYVFDDGIKQLVTSVATENARVRGEWEVSGDAPPTPYVRIALMMPYTFDATSALTMDLIKHALAGAHAAQLRANQGPGLQYQLLMANNGKDLDHWEPVVEQLAGLTGGESPLVAVMGYPNSVPATQDAAEALSKEKIPSISPVITSPDMSADRLFKAGASNEHLAQALEEHLARDGGAREGFLVWDSRKQDNYAQNLREVFMDHFGGAYGLRKRNGSYLGVIGEDAGIPQRFTPLAQKICLTGADTLFFAGRDRDLPALVTQLSEQPSCDHEKPLRIIKVGIGQHPVLTGEKITREMQEARITLVNAVDVDPRWWEGGAEAPRGFAAFEEVFELLSEEAGLGAKPLDDGYAVMYHDSFTIAAQAADASFTAANEEGSTESDDYRMPTKNDVYHTIINMSVLGTKDGSDCVDCVRGASGTFGFDADPETDKWPVCKPVPVVEYPASAASRKEGDREPYRTHQDIFGGECL